MSKIMKNENKQKCVKMGKKVWSKNTFEVKKNQNCKNMIKKIKNRAKWVKQVQIEVKPISSGNWKRVKKVISYESKILKR